MSDNNENSEEAIKQENLRRDTEALRERIAEARRRIEEAKNGK